MTQLPQNEHLPIRQLAACFNNTSATYKYYWFLSIIQSLEKGKTIIPKKELFAGMVSTAWYTVNYFHISFGKQDQLQRAIKNIQGLENITIDADKTAILDILLSTDNQHTLHELDYFNSQVPHWFLSPWFPGETRNTIYHHSQDSKNDCPYALHKEFIQVKFRWINYLLENVRLIKDFCYWNLAMFLQLKNPNVPDIPNKLIKPATRANLSGQRTKFWDIVFDELETIKCIYTGNPLTRGHYAVEHFIPYNFVSHDLMWNLIPADRSFNSSKSDKLPRMDDHFEPFFHLQKKAVKIIMDKQPRNKYLEDYYSIFPGVTNIHNYPVQFTNKEFKDRIQPLISIAANNGFEYLKR